MKSLLMLLTLSFLALGCSPVTDETETAGEDKKIYEKVEKNIGKLYTLNKIMYVDGRTELVARHDVVLKITSLNKIEGHMLCNPYFADLQWSTDGSVAINNWQKSNKTCNKPDPMVFELKMKYEFTDEFIVLKDLASSWAAYFIKL